VVLKIEGDNPVASGWRVGQDGAKVVKVLNLIGPCGLKQNGLVQPKLDVAGGAQECEGEYGEYLLHCCQKKWVDRRLSGPPGN